MKTIKHIALGLIIAAGSVGMVSCKGKDKSKVSKGEEVIELHCSGKEYFSSKKYFRANSIGESSDISIAKKKALSNAKMYLAGSIQTTIKATIDNYFNSREFNNKEQVEEKFEGLSREVINQKLSGYKQICEKLTGETMDDGSKKYRFYTAIELGADDLVDAINERLTKEESLRIDYDYEKFKETFNKEMEKLEKR